MVDGVTQESPGLGTGSRETGWSWRTETRVSRRWDLGGLCYNVVSLLRHVGDVPDTRLGFQPLPGGLDG